ncbi:MAG TPA: F0F1 ATP synthase subunit A [Kofleriaceae bacterium]|nr:F0F1 ATP synthase subunit A [Kofleriaceae bacterium]
MGEHGTWFDYLNRIPGWQSLSHKLQELLGRSWEWQMFGPSGWTLTHVLITLVVVGIVAMGGLAFYRGLKSADKGLVPPRQMNVRNFFEYLAESLYGFVEGGMGEKHARRFYPLIGGLFIFILFNNLFALVPGFVAPTDSLKTNVGIALLVFLLTHVYGVKEHGLAYFKHFLGPSPALIPLMLPIELVSHFARPVSLAVRLMGNMMADHKVIMSFFALVPVLVPLPFMLLGILISLIQAVVFCTLAMVYIGMALEHEEH